MTTPHALSDELAALDAMAVKPTSLSMPIRLTYLGGPTYLWKSGSSASLPTPASILKDPRRAKVPATCSPR